MGWEKAGERRAVGVLKAGVSIAYVEDCERGGGLEESGECRRLGARA